jgi:hypothetical protein
MVKASGKPTRKQITALALERARRQREAAMTCVMAAFPWMSLGKSPLQLHAIAPVTCTAYASHVMEFYHWCNSTHRKVTFSNMDKTLVLFFDAEFNSGVPPSAGGKLVAALLNFWTKIGDHIGSSFPEASRALRGWQRLVPSRTRQPLPFLALCAVAGRLLCMQEMSLALCLLIGFSAYLRPRELSFLLVGQLVSPPRYGGAHHRHWLVLLHSEDTGLRSKTGKFDESIVLDSDWAHWMSPILTALTEHRPESERLWPFSHEELLSKYQLVLNQCNLDVEKSIYALRHGGASHDALHKLRPLDAFRERDLWAPSSVSMARYTKLARAQAELKHIPQDIRGFAEQMYLNLSTVFNTPHLARDLWVRRAPLRLCAP